MDLDFSKIKEGIAAITLEKWALEAALAAANARIAELEANAVPPDYQESTEVSDGST